MIKIDFYDEEDTYGRIETEEKTERIEELLNEYRNSNQEDYNVDDFFKFLKSKNINFTQINLEADVNIYF